MDCLSVPGMLSAHRVLMELIASIITEPQKSGIPLMKQTAPLCATHRPAAALPVDEVDSIHLFCV